MGRLLVFQVLEVGQQSVRDCNFLQVCYEELCQRVSGW